MSKILIIEDVPFFIELYQIALEEAGYQVIQARDGEEGLKMASEHPDLILLDMMLPKISGIEVLKKLRSENSTKDIPILVLTNYSQNEIIKEANDLGIQGYLHKVEMTPTKVVEHINELLKNPNGDLFEK